MNALSSYSSTSSCLMAVAVTMGDPAGVGPEIVLKGFLQHLQLKSQSALRWLCVGDPDLLSWTADRLALDLSLQSVDRVDQIEDVDISTLPVLPTKSRVAVDHLVFGKPDPHHAPAIVESIRTACHLVHSGQCAAMTTAPIHKASLHAAGESFPGHTEMLAHWTALPEKRAVMMLVGKDLRVVPATLHLALRDVADLITENHLREIITTTCKALQNDFGIPDPRVAVAGLNPHAGEGGSFGREEMDIIAPLCEQLCEEGMSVRGPLSADTLFHPEARRHYDAVVCMYHDQALIPLKMLAFGQAVNVTLGLPIVRTSVDHGTACDIAGKNIADCRSLLRAVQMAQEIAERRR